MGPITYQISEEDYLAFSSLVYGKTLKVMMMVLGGYLAFVIGLYFLVEKSAVVFWIGVTIAALMILACIQRFFGLPRLVKATYRDDAAIKEEMTLTFDNEVFSRSFASGALSSKWADRAKWAEDENVLPVFPNRQLGHIFPKAQIGPEAITEIRNHIVDSGLPRKNRLRK